MTKRFHFTLIEVLISLGLFAGLSITCVGLLNNLSSSMEVQNERSKQVDSLVELDRTIKKMFSNMVPFKWRDEENQIMPHFSGLTDRLRFAYLNKVNNLDDGGLRFAELFIDENNQLMVVYQTRPFRDGYTPENHAYKSILSQDVESLRFDYVSVTEGQQGSENLEWLSEWEEDRLDIPLAVKMTVIWLNGNSETFFWRTAGNGYYERWGAWRNGEKINR